MGHPKPVKLPLPLLLARFAVRSVVLTISAIVFTAVAALMLTLSLFLGGDATWIKEDDAILVASSVFAFATWIGIWSAAFLPMVVAFLITELARARSFVLHIVIGGLVAVAAVSANGGMAAVVNAFDGAFSLGELWVSVLSAGFVGGLTHWLIAGHRAGVWLGGIED